MRAITGAALAIALMTCVPAAAQDDEVPPAELEARLAEARAAMQRGDPAAALTIYRTLADRMRNGASGFACEHGLALLRGSTEPLDVRLDEADALFAEAYTTLGDGAPRAACALRAGLALSQVTAASDAERREVAWLAALWLGAGDAALDSAGMRAAGIDPAAVSAAQAALPQDVRDEYARALEGASPAQAAGEQASVEGLGAAIARVTHARAPDRRASCHDEWFELADSGTIVCTWAVLPNREWGNTYPSERHVVERLPNGAYRGAASMPDADGYDCGYGLVYEVTGFVRLSPAQHGIDGWMITIAQGVEDYSAVQGDTDGTSREVDVTSTLCDRASGACTAATTASERCFTPERGRRSCTEDWAARVTVRAGRVTLANRRGRIPEGVPREVGVAVSTASARSSVALSPPPDGAQCHLETLDPHPPLNVRADASQTSAVVGTLGNGTAIRVLARRRGWLRIEAPVAGWVWSHNVRRVCR